MGLIWAKPLGAAAPPMWILQIAIFGQIKWTGNIRANPLSDPCGALQYEKIFRQEINVHSKFTPISLFSKIHSLKSDAY